MHQSLLNKYEGVELNGAIAGSADFTDSTGG